MMWFDVMCF